MIKFRMIKLAVEQFAILADTLPSENIAYSVSLGFRYALEAKRILCVFDLSFTHNDATFLVLKTNCEFEIDAQDWSSFLSEGRIRIPKPFLEHLGVHTVGAARGIMYCKTEGTPFNAIILPPVNVTELIAEGIDDPV